MVGANTSVQTGVVLAEVALGLTVPTLPSRFAVALVVVVQLDALLGAQSTARVGKTFVDISLTAGSDKSGPASALICANLVNTFSSMVAGSWVTLVDVDLTELTFSAVGTRTTEVVDQIVAETVVLTRVGFAVINVELTILPLETWWACTLVGSNKIPTCRSVLAGLA